MLFELYVLFNNDNNKDFLFFLHIFSSVRVTEWPPIGE